MITTTITITTDTERWKNIKTSGRKTEFALPIPFRRIGGDAGEENDRRRENLLRNCVGEHCYSER